MTRTFCDRCQREASVKAIVLVERHNHGQLLAKLDDRTLVEPMELCERCIAVIANEMKPLPSIAERC